MEHEITKNTEVGFEAVATDEKLNESDLPMLVWIRGDEDYADDFSLNADQAMEMIGIRRSRLTQISGKELRVGKKRIGRYVRPVFRQVDIEAYKAWTRPTATSKKSSSILEEGLDKLRELAERMDVQSLKDDVHDFFENLDGKLTKQEIGLQNSHFHGLKFRDHLDSLEIQVGEWRDQFLEDFGKYSIQIDEVFDRVNKQKMHQESKFGKFSHEIRNFNASFERMFGVLKVLAEQLESQKTLLSQLDTYHRQLQYIISLEYKKSFPKMDGLLRRKAISKRK